MRLTSKEQAKAFVFFMLSEKNRHLDDIRQIESTVRQVTNKFCIPLPLLDPREKYWVNVEDNSISMDTVLRTTYPPNPINADEG